MNWIIEFSADMLPLFVFICNPAFIVCYIWNKNPIVRVNFEFTNKSLSQVAPKLHGPTMYMLYTEFNTSIFFSLFNETFDINANKLHLDKIYGLYFLNVAIENLNAYG